MGRNKVQHKLIANEAARKNTFKKRKVGLWNKLREISTLCGVFACGIIFHDFSGKEKKNQSKVDAWPSVPQTADLLKKMKALPERKQKKYKLSHDSLLNGSVEKLEEKLKEEIEKNHLLEIEWLLKCEDDDHMKGASSYRYEDLNDLVNLKGKMEMVDNLIKKVDERIKYLENETKKE
ncbi:Agamous-like MADS-box protein AGL86 [Linum grandiflorum]